MSSDESWLAVQVDVVLDRVAAEWLDDRSREVQDPFARLLDRVEAIHQLREREGKKLGKSTQELLGWILDDLRELAEQLLPTLPDEQRAEYERKLAPWL